MKIGLPIKSNALSILLLCVTPLVFAGGGEDAVRDSMRQMLLGNSRAALTAIDLPRESFSPEDWRYVACMRERFDRKSPYVSNSVREPFVSNVLSIYERYWWEALSAPERRDALESELFARLQELVPETGANSWGDLEAGLQARLLKRGFHSQMGRTPPLRELMLWQDQEVRVFSVPLPESSEKVRVNLLDNFSSLGWSSYARCKRGANGGWATDTELFAVLPRYEGIESDKFRGSFLTHEAQHFSDKRRFPGLEAWELEYRAKLAEVWALSDEMIKSLLVKLESTQSDNPKIPHPYANYRVISNMKRELNVQGLQAQPASKLREVAAVLLVADSRQRE